jgi:hypothetical protein
VGLLEASDATPKNTLEVEDEAAKKGHDFEPSLWDLACSGSDSGELHRLVYKSRYHGSIIGLDHVVEVWATMEDLFSSVLCQGKHVCVELFLIPTNLTCLLTNISLR